MSFEGKYNTKSPAVKRLMREAQELAEPTEEYRACPLDDNLFEWHFTIQGPPSSEFAEGVYHGRILLPPEYPMKPPNIILLTPNGRFEINKKICLSISGHHPETWQPSWSIRTALLALIAFMPTPGNDTIGSLDYSPEERQKLAKKSLNWQCESCGKIADLLSKDGPKQPITQEEQHMLNTIALKAEDALPTDSSYSTDTTRNLDSDLRQRNVNSQVLDNADQAQADVIVNQQLATVSSTNDLFWSMLITFLVFAIILLVLRRLFFV
ncbi:ubiquitin-conjugating enzyme E2 J1-like [Venturia canescens]|uniref:ubiquitin-conjugating enzyme E2 J1-like n=1 Tax=Venturia canescens TaxID=32260 RepID=UPI001C9D5C37|nr:ubiquitin-conjugating enzyme E2 J1-like [Venturia canescens]